MLTHFALQIATFLLVTCTVAGLMLTWFYPRVTGRSHTQKRLASLAAANQTSTALDKTARKRSVEETLRELEEVQRAKAKNKSKPSLTIRIRQAGLTWNRKTYYALSAACGLGCFLMALITFGVPLLPAIGFGVAAGLLLPNAYVNLQRRRRFRRFIAEFSNALDVIVRGVKAGLPVGDCLNLIAAEAQEPVRGEFQLVAEDQMLGVPLDEAVDRLSERVPIPETRIFALVIAVQSRTGGSLSEALNNLSNVLRDRKKMQAKIRAMSMEAKASAAIIGAIPFVVAVLVYFTTPNYIMLLFTTTTGQMVLGACGVWMLIGSMVMRKMINFDV